MHTASSVPQTIRSMSDLSRSAFVGFNTKRPSRRPTRTAPTGEGNGTTEHVSAVDAPLIASTSGSFCPSADRTNTMIWVSCVKPFGKSGRIGRSIRRQVRISFSVGRPSRLNQPPGIRPAA